MLERHTQWGTGRRSVHIAGLLGRQEEQHREHHEKHSYGERWCTSTQRHHIRGGPKSQEVMFRCAHLNDWLIG